ncbi:MAG: ATP-binding protein [Pseudolabrys sp.]|nr:ATP-binding protein [Pseudolabrys sp.]
MALDMQSGKKVPRVPAPPSRNMAALILFGRSAYVTVALLFGAMGFYGGIILSGDTYDPHAYAMGAGTLFAGACLIIVLLLGRRRAGKTKIRKLEMRIEELSDKNWELSEAEVRARSLLEAQGDLIVRRDANGLVTYVNDAYCALAGKSRDELIGHEPALPVTEQGATAMLPDGTRAHDQKIDSALGARWIAWREVAVRGDAGNEVQGVGRDVTDRVEAERAFTAARDLAEAANRAKSRFLAMVSHEVRTPLNGLLGMADLLLDTPLTPEQLTYAKAAKTSGETLLSLIEEVLDFSKIEAGKLDLETKPLSLVALVEETVELLAPRAQAKGIDIASFIDDRLPPMVVGDAARLRQVLLNLAGNAIKFTEHGGVAVVADPGERDGEILFRVRDSGIGLAPQDQARVFLDFEQADDSTTRKFGGTGLGLAISKRIVERMQGAISVESELSQGSTFSFTVALPQAPADGHELTRPDLRHSAVLIVTAAEVEAALLARRLGHWGAKACIAADEKIALALLPERHWDTLLIDFPVAQAMMTKNSLAASDIPRRIVLIRPSDRHELPALKAAGFTGYLIKPVRAASLAARLQAQSSFEHALADGVEEINEADDDASPAAKGLSILIAEDNDINALLARALLTRLGHRPVIVPNGEAAIEHWSKARTEGAPYDLVLMDVQMPVMDGMEATRRIRATESLDTSVPPTRILALTANAYAEDRDACLAAGMDGLLVKPLDRERLRDALETAAKRASLAA